MLKLNLKKHRFIYIFLLLSFSSIVYLVYLQKKPQTPPLQPPLTKIASPQSSLNSLAVKQFTIDPNLDLNQNIPPTLPVYKIKAAQLPNFHQIAQKIASSYGLTQSTLSSNSWSSTDNTINLNYQPLTKSITFVINSDLSPKNYFGNSPPNTKSAIEAAQLLVNDQEEFRNLVLQESQISYFYLEKGRNEYEPATDPTKANLIVIPFTQNINGYPFKIDAKLAPPLYVTIGQSNQITKYVFTPQPLPEIISSQEYYTQNTEEILQALNSNQASIINAPMYAIPPDTKVLPPTTIIDIQVEYRQNSTTGELVPYFLLYGNYVAPNSKPARTYTVTLLLPAIKPTP